MNISISEIVVILLVALLVIKPEQLPEAAFAFGKITKAIQRFFAKCKDELMQFMDSHEQKNN